MSGHEADRADFIPALEEFDRRLMPLPRGPYQLR